MIIWVAFLSLSQIAYSNTILIEASVRETSEPFPYPSPWEPLRIKPTTEKLVVDQLPNEAYPKLPKPPNKEINDKDKIHQDPTINYGNESKPEHISFTWGTTKVSPDENINHETAEMKEEKNGMEKSQQILEKKYILPIAPKNEVPLGTSTSETRSPIFLTEGSQEYNSIPPLPPKEPPILVQPAASVPYPLRPLAKYIPLSDVALMDSNLNYSRNELYTPPPPIPPPREEVQVPLQTTVILIPPEEPMLFLPKLEMNYRPSETYKQYTPMFESLITPFPSSMLPPSLFQDLPLLLQPENSVSYPSRSKTTPSTPVLLPPLQPIDFKLFDPILEIASYPPHSSIISHKKDQSSSAQILMLLLPSTELVSDHQYYVQPPPKPPSFF